jgi:hypothetical protein
MSIPHDGYPSRTAYLLAKRAQGVGIAEIARQLGISTKNAVALEESARRSRKPRPAETHGRTIVFPLDVFDALRPHAAKRDLTVNELVRRLIEHALDDQLIDSIMDDAR